MWLLCRSVRDTGSSERFNIQKQEGATPTSFPPTDFVRMTADETGGGIHPTTCKLLIIES